MYYINTLRPRQNSRHFTDDIFKCIFLNENIWILIKISLKCIPNVRIINIPALVQIMAWRRSGDKPLSEPMMVRPTTHICVTRPQWCVTIRHTPYWCVTINSIDSFNSFGPNLQALNHFHNKQWLSSLTHVCATPWLQWVEYLKYSINVYMQIVQLYIFSHISKKYHKPPYMYVPIACMPICTIMATKLYMITIKCDHMSTI